MISHGYHYNRIRVDDDPVRVAEAAAYFHAQYAEAAAEIKVKGTKIGVAARDLPGYTEYRYAQLQEIDAIRVVLKVRLDKVQHEARRRYLENYNRTLSERLADKYAENDDAVVEANMLLAEMDYVRGLFIGITKGQESLNRQIYNIMELRKHGLEDSIL